MDLQKFIQKYPNLYHMAEAGTWDSIQEFGLLSTSAILDHHDIRDPQRAMYELNYRPTMMEISSNQRQTMILRDQVPMPPNRMSKGLLNGITTGQWYLFLNNKVFFWATRARLMTLLNARNYRNTEHDILTLDTSSFIRDYENRVTICHMNSGNTFPIPHPRDYSIFKSIPEYPTNNNGNPLKEVAEVTVDYSVANISDYVVKVERMQGSEVVQMIYENPDIN